MSQCIHNKIIFSVSEIETVNHKLTIRILKSRKIKVKVINSKMCRKMNMQFTSNEKLPMGRGFDLGKIPGDNFDISSNNCCSSLSIFSFVDMFSS